MKRPPESGYVSILTFVCQAPMAICGVASIAMMVYHREPAPPALRMFCTSCKSGAKLHTVRTEKMADLRAKAEQLAAQASDAPAP